MSGPSVVAGAGLMCPMGAAPSALVVLPIPGRPLVEGRPAATIMDVAPMVNIPTFGMCHSLGNPTVAAATAAALGTLTPMPCVPMIAAPWGPGSPTTSYSGQPALTPQSTCACVYGGVIGITSPGSAQTQVG